MRKLSACLVAALLAVPTSGIAGPDKTDAPRVERFEWSSNQARLGVMVMSLTPELRAYFGAPHAHGVLVAKIEPGSPAAKAGIKVGDVLTTVKGENIDDAADVLEALSSAKQGDKVTVWLVRDKKPMSIETTIGGTSASAMPSSLQSFLRETMPWFDFGKGQRSSSTLGGSSST